MASEGRAAGQKGFQRKPQNDSSILLFLFEEEGEKKDLFIVKRFINEDVRKKPASPLYWGETSKEK